MKLFIQTSLALHETTQIYLYSYKINLNGDIFIVISVFVYGTVYKENYFVLFSWTIVSIISYRNVLEHARAE